MGLLTHKHDTAVQALMVYFQWLQMLRSLPIEWLPASLLSPKLEATPSESQPNQLKIILDALRSLFEAFSKAWNLLSGRAASLDCLFQGLDVLQGSTQGDIATNIILRGLARWVRTFCMVSLRMRLDELCGLE